MIEDVALDVVVVELLRREDDGNLRVIQLCENLDEKVLVADHIGIKDDYQLHSRAPVRSWICQLSRSRCLNPFWLSPISSSFISIDRCF